MNAASTSIAPMPGRGDRVVGVDGRRIHDALFELHTLAVLEIDRGNQKHGWAYSVPLVDGVSDVRGSGSSAARRARPNALKTVSA